MAPRLSYFICTNARSGSWLLAAGLEDTGLAGHPSEWFNQPEEKLWCGRWGIPYPIVNYEEYVNKALEAGTAGTDIFGVKCLGENFKDLTRNLRSIREYRDLPINHVISMVFPNTHYIRLVRRDMLRQAISFYRAAQTQLWFSIVGEQDAPGDPPIYDPVEILRHEHMLIELEAMWDDYFCQAGLKHLMVYYEDLAANYAGTIRQVLAYLGINGAEQVEIGPPRFRKQADEITEDWLERYREYKASNRLP